MSEIFRGFAQGRAIVRNRAMREARRWQKILAHGDVELMRLALMNTLPKRPKRGDLTRAEYLMIRPDGLRHLAHHMMESEVRRARQAHQDWRKYRATHVQLEHCFACGRRLGYNPALVDTRDAQTVFVGRECMKQIEAAGEAGWQPPKGGPRLYPLNKFAREQ